MRGQHFVEQRPEPHDAAASVAVRQREADRFVEIGDCGRFGSSRRGHEGDVANALRWFNMLAQPVSLDPVRFERSREALTRNKVARLRSTQTVSLSEGRQAACGTS
jgi:hypothetical protein